MKRLLPFFFVVCTLILFFIRCGYQDFHIRNDGENHLARIANYALALRQVRFHRDGHQVFGLDMVPRV